MIQMLNCCLNLPIFNSGLIREEIQQTKVSDLKVLVVDDNVIFQKLLHKMLKKYYFINNITLVDGPKKALRLLKQTRFDIIFMDIDMPEMSGVECSRIIRNGGQVFNYNRYIPIIAVTTNSGDEDIKLYKSVGMNGHIQKPYDFHKLGSYLELAINLKSKFLN